MNQKNKNESQLLKAITITASQINQLEGERGFLLQQLSNSYVQDLIPVIEKLTQEPEIIQALGEPFIKGVKLSIIEAKDEPLISRAKSLSDFYKINGELKQLHKRQISDYKAMKRLINSFTEGFSSDSFERSRTVEALTDAIDSCANMVKLLDDQHEIISKRLA